MIESTCNLNKGIRLALDACLCLLKFTIRMTRGRRRYSSNSRFHMDRQRALFDMLGLKTVCPVALVFGMKYKY